MQLNIGDALGRYRIASTLGSGGMGTVYLARDTTLQREVAIKVLNEDSVSDPTNVERFKREAKAVAGLSHPNIISLYDFAEQDNTYYAVMEYARGVTLDDKMAESSLSRDSAIDIATGMARGLAAAHRGGIVHRDIKPSNVLLTDEGEVKLLDFGLATARQSPELSEDTVSVDDLRTQVGTIMGTVGYMSPEQVKGKTSDQRSDVFSFGAVLYEMLTGKRAFKRDTAVETLSAILNESVPTVDRPELDPTDPFFSVMKRCLEKAPDDRYPDMSTMMADLTSSSSSGDLEPRAAGATGMKRYILAGVGVVVAILLVVLLSRGREDDAPGGGTGSRPEAPGLLLTRLVDLTAEGNYAEAYEVALQVQGSFADDVLFQRAWENITWPHSLTSEPAGATVLVGEYGAAESTYTEFGTTPIEKRRLSKTPKIFVMRKEGFHDEILTSDSSTAFSLSGEFVEHRVLDEVGTIPDGMIRVTAGPGFALTGMVFDKEIAEGFALGVPDFLMDRYEVSNREYLEFVRTGGYFRPEYWTDPFISTDGAEITRADAMRLLVDSTGRPGPSTWSVGSFPSGQASYPVQGVSWYEARAYANFVGKSLPTLYHWSRGNPSIVGADGLQQMISLSNINTGEYAAVGSYKAVSPFGAYDLCGNVAEWVWNAVGDQRLSLGGSAEEQAYFFNQANPVDPFDRSRLRGFRCVKFLAEPTEEQIESIELQYRDYTNPKPVPDEVFSVYHNQFQYDSAPLNPMVVYRKESEYPDYIKERVEFDAVYGGERIICYLYLPKNSSPPYQTVVYFQNASAINPIPSEENAHGVHSYIPQSGRALIHPVLKGQWERNGGLLTWASNDSQHYADFLIKWVKDYRRTLDYVASRPEFDMERVAYVGDSWGAVNYVIVAAVESRIRLGLCYVGGLSMTPARAEVDQISYVSRVRQPTLWLAGEYDQIFPLAQSSRPAFQLMGTPEKDKRMVIYESGHTLPHNELIRESLDWLDKYFGPVKRRIR